MKLCKEQIKDQILKVIDKIDTTAGEFEMKENENTLFINFILEDEKGNKVCSTITSIRKGE